MKSRSLIVAAGILIAFAAIGRAQEAPVGSNPKSFTGAPRAGDLIAPATSSGFSLLDPSRFRLSHSYSMTYFSGSGYSGSVGLYMSTLNYQLSRPLSLRIGLGYLHQPLGFLGSSAVGPEGGQILPNVRLDFRPSDALHFRFDYRTIPTSVYGGRYGWGPYVPRSRTSDRLWDW